MLKSAIVAAALFLPTLANASDGARYLNLSQCMAYAAVKGGLDGKKEPPREYADVIAALGEEYMVEASMLGMDDNQAHTFVVNELIRQNRIKEEEGIDALHAELKEKCSALLQEIIAAGQK